MRVPTTAANEKRPRRQAGALRSAKEMLLTQCIGWQGIAVIVRPQLHHSVWIDRIGNDATTAISKQTRRAPAVWSGHEIRGAGIPLRIRAIEILSIKIRPTLVLRRLCWATI